MSFLLIFVLAVSPFCEANFSSLPLRSISVFSNPAGLGIRTGAEIFLTYKHEPSTITSGASLGNIGVGIKKLEDTIYYEIGVGYKLPGAFSVGYAYQFGDTSSHVLGVMCQPHEYFTAGYRTTLMRKKHMFGGVAIKPYQDYITLNFDLEYEGIDDIFTYYYGVTIQPLTGLKINFAADSGFNWHAGLELSLDYVKLAGLYSYEDKKISGGIILSAQRYETPFFKEEEPVEIFLR